MDDEEGPAGEVIDEQDDQSPTDTNMAVEEETIPLDTLPKTGQSSPIPYYLIGAFAITTGFILLRKQRHMKQ